MRRLLNPLLTACLSTVVLTSTVLTTAQASEPVVVSSKIDTEGSVLGELIIQTLERHGIATQGRLQLGATSVVRNALLAAEIDVYPEYTGNGAFFFDMTDSPVWNSADDAYQTVRERDAEQGLIISEIIPQHVPGQATSKDGPSLWNELGLGSRVRL